MYYHSPFLNRRCCQVSIRYESYYSYPHASVLSRLMCERISEPTWRRWERHTHVFVIGAQRLQEAAIINLFAVVTDNMIQEGSLGSLWAQEGNEMS